jgi:hypothetical protein
MPTPEPKLRWFHSTPSRFLLIILAWEGVLFLFEQFHWVQKGWSVIIAIASLGAALSFLILWFIFALLFHWRFRYGIRTLIATTVVVAIPFSWLAVEMKKAREQRLIADEIIQSGGGCMRFGGGQGLPMPPGDLMMLRERLGLSDLLGRDFFSEIGEVILYKSKDIDTALEHLEYLKSLGTLRIFESPITDTGMNHLKKLNQLGYLCILETDISAENIKQLQQELPNCKVIIIDSNYYNERKSTQRKGLPDIPPDLYWNPRWN